MSLGLRDFLDSCGWSGLGGIEWDEHLFVARKTPRRAMETVWAYIFSLHPDRKFFFKF